jgi:hypothetical protein
MSSEASTDSIVKNELIYFDPKSAPAQTFSYADLLETQA